MIVKICGLTNLDDALAAAELGADYLGFNFYPKSPRCIAETECAKIAAALRARFPKSFVRRSLRQPPDGGYPADYGTLRFGRGPAFRRRAA